MHHTSHIYFFNVNLRIELSQRISYKNYLSSSLHRFLFFTSKNFIIIFMFWKIDYNLYRYKTGKDFTMNINKVALIGAGAIGAYFVWGFQQKKSIDFCVVAEGERKNRLLNQGLIINDQTYHFPVKDYNEAGTVDLILIGTKNNAIEDVAQKIIPMLKDDTIVLSLLNGVESEDILKKYIDEKHIMYSFMRISAERTENSIFFNPVVTDGVIFGEQKGVSDTSRITALKEVFEGAVHYIVSEDIEKDMWIKFANNVANNLPQAILNVGVGAYIDSDHVAHIAQCLWNEVGVLASMRNITLPDYDPSIWAARKNSRFSTLQDLDAKRKTEIDSFAGAVMKLSEKAGVSSPYCDYTYHLIKALEQKNDGIFEY